MESNQKNLSKPRDSAREQRKSLKTWLENYPSTSQNTGWTPERWEDWKQTLRRKRMNEEKDFYIATLDEKGDFIVYDSIAYKLSEIDLINVIKILMIEKRNTGIGRKFLDAYRDATEHRKDITEKRLNIIGIPTANSNDKPTVARRTTKK